MRGVRRLGEEALSQAEEARKAVRKNRPEAEAVYHRMKAYKLLADYYERKVLATTCALIYGFGGPPGYKAEAERHADEAVALYEKAITFIGETIDRKSGALKGHWGGKALTLAELIEHEKTERKELSKVFKWPATP